MATPVTVVAGPRETGGKEGLNSRCDLGTLDSPEPTRPLTRRRGLGGTGFRPHLLLRES